LQTALQKLKPDSWEDFTFKDEFLAKHPSYAYYEPQNHIDWLPQYRSIVPAKSENKGNGRSKRNSSNIEKYAEDSNNVQCGKNGDHLRLGITPSIASDGSVSPTKTPGRTYNWQSNANDGTMPLPQHRYVIQPHRELKRSRSEAELDDEVSETAAGFMGRQLKKKQVD
jgi:hypothetical protein